MSRFRACLLAPLLALAACSSSSTGNGPDTTGTDSAAGQPADGAGVPAPADAGADATVDAPQGPLEAAADGGDAAQGVGPAGKAGVDAYSATLCSHEQTCSAIDAGAASLATCEASFKSFYETSGASPWVGNPPGTPPPLELWRADYVSALGSCIARASCSEGLAASEARCSAALVAGADGGAATITPTPALTSMCRAFQASSCLAADSGAQDCAATFALYSDQALNAGAACFSGSSSSCPTVTNCFVAAFTQP